MDIQKINSTSFKAIPLADIKVKGFDKSYKLYEITKRDEDYLENFYHSLNLKQIMPGLKDEEYTIWNGVIQSAIDLSNKGGRKTILETCDSKPCGLINFSSFTNKFHINYVATFPVEPKTKVPFAGQILFNEVFKRVLDSCTDMVELKALRYSPFSPISKYLKLGMKPMGGTDYYEKMRLERNEILSAVNKQEQFFTVTEINDRRDIPLDKCCNKHGLFHRLFLRFSNIM